MNEVRKPRDFWVAEDGDNFICQPTKPEKEVFETLDVIHCKEILPGDDSIRDLALAKIRLKRAEDAAYHALLHMSAWLGIPDKKREQFIEDEMGNVRFCCQNNLPQDLERIERENKGE